MSISILRWYWCLVGNSWKLVLENLILKELVDRVCIYIYISYVYSLEGIESGESKLERRMGRKFKTVRVELVRGRRKKRSIIVERWSERYGCYSKGVHP